MGLLDDAIKEHLELKRRHGADPGEVARLEHEALGPARRDPAPAAVDEPVAAAPAAAAVAPVAPVADDDLFIDDGEHDEVPAEERLEAPIHHIEPEPEPEPVAEAAPAPAPAPAPEPPAEVEQPTRQFSLEEVEAATAPPEAPAEPEAPPTAERAAPPAEDVVPADDEPEGEDVLEETPEFLQETPEHDRLWFEQKPPRDFDFDR
jgi:hypothetical protein